MRVGMLYHSPIKAPTLPMRLKRQLSGGYVPDLLRGGVRTVRQEYPWPSTPLLHPLRGLYLYLVLQQESL